MGVVDLLFCARRYFPIQIRVKIRRRRKTRTPRTMPISALGSYLGGLLGVGAVESEGLGDEIPLAVVVTKTVTPTVFVWPKNEVTREPETVKMDSLGDGSLDDIAPDD